MLQKKFISLYLQHLSFLIKRTSVTARNKTIFLYESFSHFSGKTTKRKINLLDLSNFLKFFCW